MSSTEKPRRGRWRRVGTRLVILVVVLAIVLPVSLVLGLQIGAVRQAILGRVAVVVEDRTGIRLHTRDFRLGLTTGELEIYDLELTASPSKEASPFLVVPEARAVIRWRSLLGEVAVIESVRIVNPRIDLGAPLPTAMDESDEETTDKEDFVFPAVDLLALDLSGGEVIGTPAPESMDMWLDTWRADEIRVRGALRSGKIRAEEVSTRLIVGSHRRESLELRARLAASGDVKSGALVFDALEVRSNGLKFDGRGEVDLSTFEGRCAFDLDARPAILVPDLTSDGRLVGSGDLVLDHSPEPELSGTLQIEADDIPGDLAQPWLGFEGGGFLDVVGTQLDAKVDLDLGVVLSAEERHRSEDRFLGAANVTWRRGSERLLTATVESLDDGGGVNLRFAGQLTPASPGRRKASGVLEATSFLQVLDGTLRSVHVDLFEPDIAEAAERFGLDPRAVPEWWPRGSVSATLDAEGPVANPRLEFEARWDHEGGETLAVVSARTLDDTVLRLGFETTILPELAGRSELSGELMASDWPGVAEGEIRDGLVVLELAHLGKTDVEMARRLPGLLPQGLLPDAIPDELLESAVSVRAQVAGPLLTPQVELEAAWSHEAGEDVRLVAHGSPAYDYPFVAPGSSVGLSVNRLSLSRFDPAETPSLAGRIDGSFRLDVSDRGDLDAHLRLDGDQLTYGDLASFDRLAIEVTSDGETIELSELSGDLTAGTPELPVRGTLIGEGHSDVAWPPRRAEARLSMANPVRGVDRVDAFVRFEDGVLHIEGIEIESLGNVASIRGKLPIGGLAALSDAGPMSLTLSDLDLQAVARSLATDEEPLPVHGRVNASISFDPADPVSATGDLEVSGIAVTVDEDAPLELGQTLRVEMRNGRITVPPTRLQPTGGLIRGDLPLDLSATVDLARDWRPGDDPATLVENVALELNGTVDATLLNPFLAGGVANGEVALEISAEGPPDTLAADVLIWGPDARVLYRRPYPTRLENLDVHIIVRRGEVTLEHARARINGGTAELAGTLTEKDGLRANLRFDDARYRLEFNITTLLRGDLQLEWPPTGRRRIAGRVVVERAVLRSPIRLTRDVLGVLFDVRPESGGEFPLDTIDLDLIVETDQGIVINNNVADVQADWGRLEITGTAAEPLLDGRVDVQPGGIITAFGQALRIDEASFEWSGQPVTEPRMIFETTSSLDDPNILKSWRNEFFNPADMGPGQGGTLDFWGQGQGQGGQGGGWEQLAAGAVTQATSANRTQLTFEPLPLFGETDTQARYTLASELSPQLTFIASTNPRETEAQTYILDIHRMPVLQTFRAQVFTNDQKNAGLTIQQTLKLGKALAIDTKDPFLRSTSIVIPEGLKKRTVRRAIGYRKTERFPRGAGLDVEVDVMDLMRRRGFPSAAVEVDVEATDNNRVDLVVTIEPGEQVKFFFEGERLSSRIRRNIASSYRPRDLGERAALEDVQRETVTVLRGMGFLEPRVDVEAILVEMTPPDEPAAVRVTMDGGRQVELSELVVGGLDDAEDAEHIVGRFESTLSRVRLAIAIPASDALMRRALDRRGYPQAQITGRRISEDGQTLYVDVEPGVRRRVASIQIVGLNEEDRARLTESLDVHVGDPARQDVIGLAGRLIEADLRQRGHADARVTVNKRPAAEDRPYEIELRFDVDPGPSYEIRELRFEGLKASRYKWVEGVAGLESGETFRRRDVSEARARLFRTGVFRRIQTSSDSVSPDTDGAGKVVTFDVEESRRWQLAYGGRWEEGRGLSVVADLLNRHSFGVGHLTGIRGILGTEQRNLRLYHVIPRIVGQQSSLEMLIEAKREPLTTGVDVQGMEAWAQVTFPISERLHNRPYIRFQNPTLIEEDPDPDEPIDDRVISPLLGYQVAFDSTSRRLGEQRRQGVFVGADFLGSHEGLGSDVTYFGVVSQLKYFWPLGHEETGRFTWAQFWRGGWTEAEDQPVPFVDRFRVGGEFSVRGYPTNSLGPRDEDGVALGGELLFVVNQEIHAQLLRTERMGTVAALAFFDAGNVWLDRQSLGGGLFKSVGLGARYLSPVGPLRLDLGVPLDRRPDDPSYKLYFGFGSVF